MLHPYRPPYESATILRLQEAETDNNAKANPVDLDELRNRIDEVVPTKELGFGTTKYEYIDSYQIMFFHLLKLKIVEEATCFCVEWLS